MPNPNLFTEFSTTSKAEWLNKIEKDLKGRSIADLMWDIPSLSINPFAHADDFTESLTPLQQKSSNAWEICVDIEVIDADFAKANARALSALSGGANAIKFIFASYPSENELLILVENIELDYISVHFVEKSTHENPLDFLKTVHKIVSDKGKTNHILRGSVSHMPLSNKDHGREEIKELIEWARINMPHFKIFGIYGNAFFKGSEQVIEELANTLIAGEKILKMLVDKNLSIPTINNLIYFDFSVGISYFIEIAKFRAFKLLWANVLTAYLPTVLENSTSQNLLPTLYAYVSPETQIEDAHTNKIRATTQAMSAVMGGVDMLTIAPSDAYSGLQSDFNQRIALNVQHLLYMESYLDKVTDPAAGSYYIEKLTHQIAETVWQQFQESTI